MTDSGLKTPQQTPSRSRTNSDPSSRLGLPLKSPASSSFQIHHDDLMTPSSTPSRKPLATPSKQNNLYDIIKTNAAIMSNSTSTWTDALQAMDKVGKMISSDEFKLLLKEDEPKALILYELLEKSILNHVPAKVSDLRAQVCRSACELTSHVVATMNDRSSNFVRSVVPSLLKTLVKTNKVFQNFSNTAMLSIAKDCHFSSYASEVISGAMNKHPSLREKCIKYLLLALTKHSAAQLEDPDCMIDKAIEAVKECLADSKTDVRENAFKCFTKIELMWPEKSATLVESLDPTTLKQLRAVAAKSTTTTTTTASSLPSTRPSFRSVRQGASLTQDTSSSTPSDVEQKPSTSESTISQTVEKQEQPTEQEQTTSSCAQTQSSEASTEAVDTGSRNTVEDQMLTTELASLQIQTSTPPRMVPKLPLSEDILSNIADSPLLTPPASNSLINTPLRGDDSSPLFVAQKQEPMLPNFDLAPTKLEMSPLFKPQTEPILPLDVSLPSFQLPEMDQQSTFNTDYISADQMPVPVDNIEEAMEAAQLIPEPIVVSEIELTEANIEPTATKMIEETVEPIVEAEVSEDTVGAPQLLDFDVDSTPAEPEAVVEHSGAKILVDFDFLTPTTEGYEAGAEQPLEMQPSAPVVNWMDASLCEDMSYSPASTCEPTIYNPPVGECLIGDFDFSVTATPSKNKRMIDLTDTLKPTVVAELGISLLSDLDIASSNAATDSVSESISVVEVVESQESILDVNAGVAPELEVPLQALETEICQTNEQLDEGISDHPTLQEIIFSEEVKLSEEIVDCDVEADQSAVPAEHELILQNEQQVEVDTSIQDDKTIEENDKIEEDTNVQEDDTFEDDVNVEEESESVEEPLEAAETPISGAIRILVDQQDSEYLQDEIVPPVYSERRRHLSLSTIDEVSEPCTPHASPRLSILSRDFSHSAYASDDGFDSFDNFDDEFTQLMRSEVSIRSRSSLLVTNTVDDDVSSELDQYAQKHVPVGFSCTQFEQSIPSRPQIEDIAEMYENSEDENDAQESVDVPAFVGTQDHSVQSFNEDIAAPALYSASIDENSTTEQQIEVIEEEVNEMDMSVAEVDGTEDTAQIASDYGNLSIEDSAEATAKTAIETNSNADMEEPCLSGDVATSELELVEEELKNVTIDETTTDNIDASIDQIPDVQETGQQETNEELIDDYQTSSEMLEISNETADLSEEPVVDALIPEVEKFEFVQSEAQSFAQITSELEQEVVASDPVAEIEELEVDEMEPDMIEDSTSIKEDLVTVEQEEVEHPVPHAEESVAEQVSMESASEIVEETVSEVEIQAGIEEAAAEEEQVEEEVCNLMAEHVDEIGISDSVELLAESTEVIEEDDNQESVSVEIVSMAPSNDDETVEFDQQEQETEEQATTVETLEETTEINEQETEEQITLVEVPEQTTEIAESEETEEQTTLIEAPEDEVAEINEPEEQTQEQTLVEAPEDEVAEINEPEEQTEDQTTFIEAPEETTNEPEQETEEQIALIEVPEDTCVEDVKMDDAQEVPIVDNGVEQVEQQEETQEAEAEAEEEQSEEVEEELVKPTTRGRSKRTAAVAKKTSTRRRKATDLEPEVSVEPEAVKVDSCVAVAAEPAKTRGRGRKASTKEHESAVQAEVIEEKPLVQEVVKPALRGRTSKRNLIAEEHVELEAKDAQTESNQDEMEEAEEEKSATATRRGTRRATSSTVARRGRAKSSSVAVVSAEEEHEDEVETEIVEEIAAPVRRGRGKKATAAIQPQTIQDSTTVISDDEKHEQEEPEIVEQVTAPRRGRGKKVAAIVPAVEVEEVEEPAPTKTRGRGRGRKVAATEEVAEEVEETIEEPAEEEQTEVRSTRRGTRTTKSTSATKSTVPSKASTVASKSKVSTEEDKENSKRQTAKSTAQPLQAKVGLKEQSSEPKPSTPIANRVRARASRLK